MHFNQPGLLVGAIAVSALSSPAQNVAAPPAPSPPHPIADSWHHLVAIAPSTHIHVAADDGGATCYFIAVDDESLTCGRSNGSDKGRHVFPRAKVKSVKLTRYALSTLSGLGIGTGVGVGIGFAATPSTNDALGRDVLREGAGLLGALGGTVIGAASDMFRGPTVYRRARKK